MIRLRRSSFWSSVSFARLVKQEIESESKYFISDSFIENRITSPSISISSPLSFFLISQANIADEIYRKLSETQKNMIDDLKEIHYTDFIKSEENVLILLDMLESQANNPE